MSDGLYLYCVLPAGHSPPGDLRGIDDSPVEPVDEGGLTIWVSRLARRPAASIEAIRRHNAVVEAAMEPMVTPVPLRFGQHVHASELPARVAERRAAWAAALDEFAGCAEYGVRVLEPGRAPAARDVREPAPSGRAYMEALARAAGLDRERRERAQSLAARLRMEAGDSIVRDRVEPLPSTHGLASIAHLVGGNDVEEYHQGINSVRAALPALRFLTSGPWPPYSFAE